VAARNSRTWKPGRPLEDILADYSEDAILVAQKKVYRGKDGAREVFTQLLSDVPQAQWELDTVFADDVLYLEWKAAGGGRRTYGPAEPVCRRRSAAAPGYFLCPRG
jgi:hypothetical protein